MHGFQRRIILNISNSPASYVSPRAAVLTRCTYYRFKIVIQPLKYFRLYTDLVNDELTEFAYDAGLAGLSYHFSHSTTGLYVYTSGYNDKLPILVKSVLQKARELEAKTDRLAVMKEQVSLHADCPQITNSRPIHS